MLIACKERLLPVTVNTLVLLKDDFYFYIHRDVYDQAVILSDRHKELNELVDLIGKSDLNHETVQWFYSNAPKPIHILAPYMYLVDGPIDPGMEECCGVLHVISTMIHLRNFLTKPPEIRKSVSFSLTIKEEYEMAWDRFIQSAIPYEQRLGLLKPPSSESIPIPFVPLETREPDPTLTVPLIKNQTEDKQEKKSRQEHFRDADAEKSTIRKLLE